MISYDDIKSGRAVATATVAAVAKEIGTLPAMVKAAAAKLASAATAAEVLDAKDAAALVYDASKRAARMAKAKKAHDDLIAAAHRAQADALEIEAAAKRRLADEYDGGQERGELAKPGKPVNVPAGNNKAKVEETGLTRKQVHDARQVRDAELASPGVVRQALDEKLAAGEEPTRAAVNSAIAKVFGKTQPASKPRIILDEFVALWCEASTDDREGILGYLRINGFIPSSNPEPDDVDRSAERASSAVEVGATNSPDGATSCNTPVSRAAGFDPAEGQHGEQGQDGSYCRDSVERHASNPVANVGEGANGAIAVASDDPASRDADGADRQQSAVSGFTGGGDGRDVEAAGGAASVTNISHSAFPAVEQAVTAPQATRPAVTAEVSDLPVSSSRQVGKAEASTSSLSASATQFTNPRCLNACHFAHSRDACHECLVAWSARPKSEQIRLWAEANEAARAV